MRLIDLIAQTREPFVVERGHPPRRYRLRGAADLAPQVSACPMRYLLTDELARTCAELAYSCGDRLVTCLDLVRVPAPALWVEWSDRAALEGAAGFFGDRLDPEPERGRRIGLYIECDPSGRVAMLRAFWSQDGEAMACSVDALLDLREDPRFEWPHGPLHSDRSIVVTDPMPAVARLLDCARFRFEESWARYYDEAVCSQADQLGVIRSSLGGIARDVPLLIAFLLLLGSREGVAVRPVVWDALNRKRVRHGQIPLLDHLEASLTLQPTPVVTDSRVGAYVGRFSPRRHHVRGHLVRRRNQIYWRRPHVRGNSFRGEILSRTVTLEFGEGERAARNAPQLM